MIAAAFDAGLLALDTETTSLDPMQAELVGIALATAPGEACYIPLGHRGAGEGGLFGEGGSCPASSTLRVALDRLRPLFEAPGRAEDRPQHEIRLAVFARTASRSRPFDDTMLLSYVLDAAAKTDGHGLDALAKRHLGHKPIAFKDLAGSGKSFIGFARVAIDKATDYAAEDADVTLRLWRVLKPRLPAERMTTVYETLERPLVEALGPHGAARHCASTSEILSRLSGDFAQSMARLEAEIYEHAGQAFNLGSPKQLGDILFGKMGLPGAKKTATGAWSTSARVLDDLAEDGNGFARLILDWRQVAKLKQTYTDALPAFPTQARTGSTPPSSSPPRRPDGSPRPSRTCRTSRSAPRPAARSAPPSWRRPATSSLGRLFARSSCGCSPISPTSRS